MDRQDLTQDLTLAILGWWLAWPFAWPVLGEEPVKTLLAALVIFPELSATVAERLGKTPGKMPGIFQEKN